MAIKINGVTVIDDSRNGTLVTSTATGNVVGGNVTTAGLISAAGNITGNYILGNGALLTGIITSVANINNGTTIMEVVSSGGNIRANIGGTSNVFVLSTGGAFVTGVASASGNVTGSNILTSGQVSATGNVTGGGITLSGNTILSTGSTLTIDPSTSGVEGSVIIAGNLSVQGNVTYIDSTEITTNEKDIVLANNVNTQTAVNGAGLLLGNNSVVTWTYNNTSNAWTTNVGVSAVGNVIGGNLSGTNIVGTLTTAAQTNITSVGTLTSLNSGAISSSGNVTAANFLTAGLISATGNVSGGNLNVTGNIVDTGAMSIITGSNGNITLNAGTGFIIASSGILNGQANGVGNIGNATGYFNTIFAKATSAQYADLAEMYEADRMIDPGTVVCFGGSKEVEICDQDSCRRVAGVVSTNPSYIMNAGLSGDHVVAVALTGRVPTRVTGTIRKGDMLVSTADGRARAETNPAVGAVIGKALADFDGADGTIEVVVGRL